MYLSAFFKTFVNNFFIFKCCGKRVKLKADYGYHYVYMLVTVTSKGASKTIETYPTVKPV